MRVKTIGRIRLLAFFITLVVFSSITIHSYAYIPCMCNNPPDQCTCFIQLGDKGLAVERIIENLIKKGYLKVSDNMKEFTPDVKQAVIKLQADNGLDCTGWMDDETLDALLFDILPDESEKHSENYWNTICFVPTDGGKRHHADPTCSDMLNPRMISRVNAESLGIRGCGKNTCSRCFPLTYSSLGLTPRILPDKYYVEEENEENASSIPDRSLPSDSTEIEYIGNKNSHVFHRGTCKSVSDMSEKNKIGFPSRDEAIENGYKPCGRCNP